jgi:peroxiredoxin
LRSRFRGDVIHWEKLGIDPPAFWKDASPGPGQKKNSDPKSQAFFDLDGKEHKPLQVDKGKANVLIFTTTDCPIANSYIPEINKMAQEFDNSSIKFFAIQVDPELSVEDAKKHQKAYELKIPVIRDTEHRLVKATTVTHTPEVAVVIPDGTIVYKGRIDDRYPSIGKKRSAPNQRDLYAVLSSIAKGDKPTATTTPAVGCFIPELPGNK